MFFHIILARFEKLLHFHLTELHRKVITLSHQIKLKGNNGHVIVQGLPLYMFVPILLNCVEN